MTIDLCSVAQRLDANEKLKIKYRYPAQLDDGTTSWNVRIDKLLDVDSEREMLYVAFEGDSVIWVKIDEAIEIASDDGIYEA